MNLSKKLSQTDAKLSSPNKATTLNPNAAEFVPFSLRTSLTGTSSSVDATARLANAGALGKAVLDRSESSISNNSDDEVHQYWRCQLPDDITPDFKEELSQQHIHGNSFTDRLRFSNSSFREDPSSASFLNTSTNPWDRPIGSANQLVSSGQEGLTYDDNSRHGFFNDIFSENAIMDDTNLNPLEFLASLFPGFAAESLAEVYFANGCDLHMTIEMLTQLELQVDGSFQQNLNSKTLSAPNLSAMDFPALTSPDGQTASIKFSVDNVQQSGNPYRSSEKDILSFKTSSSIPSRGSIDFASAVRKLASQESGIWKYDKSGSGDASIGSSRTSHVLAGYDGGLGRASFSDRLQTRGSARAAPVWVDTGDAVANMYSELREEARDHARLRNAYFEQVGVLFFLSYRSCCKCIRI
ncbi:hypothetical protein PIB30_001371 [Stylosanthes scabra]|uniref:Uncharacterized protein n=1 Tax=Stylosanthes scabra TaxID=79078 RepID=A0ABU6Y124_9FABA|nr:hypothetical protein [Stylosanthes scabra]